MSKKIEREYRDRRLTTDEIARDEQVRHEIQAEFPPAPPSDRASGALSQALRNAIRSSDRSVDQIAQDAGVSQIVVSRFVSGESDIHMATADKLAVALGLRLALTL